MVSGERNATLSYILLSALEHLIGIKETLFARSEFLRTRILSLILSLSFQDTRSRYQSRISVSRPSFTRFRPTDHSLIIRIDGEYEVPLHRSVRRRCPRREHRLEHRDRC